MGIGIGRRVRIVRAGGDNGRTGTVVEGTVWTANAVPPADRGVRMDDFGGVLRWEGWMLEEIEPLPETSAVTIKAPRSGRVHVAAYAAAPDGRMLTLCGALRGTRRPIDAHLPVYEATCPACWQAHVDNIGWAELNAHREAGIRREQMISAIATEQAAAGCQNDEPARYSLMPVELVRPGMVLGQQTVTGMDQSGDTVTVRTGDGYPSMSIPAGTNVAVRVEHGVRTDELATEDLVWWRSYRNPRMTSWTGAEEATMASHAAGGDTWTRAYTDPQWELEQATADAPVGQATKVYVLTQHGTYVNTVQSQALAQRWEGQQSGRKVKVVTIPA